MFYIFIFENVRKKNEIIKIKVVLDAHIILCNKNKKEENGDNEILYSLIKCHFFSLTKNLLLILIVIY